MTSTSATIRNSEAHSTLPAGLRTTLRIFAGSAVPTDMPSLCRAPFFLTFPGANTDLRLFILASSCQSFEARINSDGISGRQHGTSLAKQPNVAFLPPHFESYRWRNLSSVSVELSSKRLRRIFLGADARSTHRVWMRSVVSSWRSLRDRAIRTLQITCWNLWMRQGSDVGRSLRPE